MISPGAYNTLWQKFENFVYSKVCTKLGKKYIIKYGWPIEGLTPDITVLAKCVEGGIVDKDYETDESEGSCEKPILIFDSHCKWKMHPKFLEQKDRQMKKYSKICASILVTPDGYNKRPHCKSSGGEYHIIAFPTLDTLLNCVGEIHIDAGRGCPDCSEIYTENIFKRFELELKSQVDRCPHCKSSATAISLIFCKVYDMYLYPDFLDWEEIEHGMGDYTDAECAGCSHNEMGYDFQNCPYADMEYHYQCKKCGAIFDCKTLAIIRNFEDAHKDLLKESFDFYRETS
jgi:hypothetical protein